MQGCVFGIPSPEKLHAAWVQEGWKRANMYASHLELYM